MAVLGIYGTETADVASSIYYGLYALQHRGQASSGIVVNDDGVFHAYKDVGIVNEVFTPLVLKSLGLGQMAVGNVRYGTSDTKDRINSEPIVVNHSKGRMAISLDGKLVNSVELKQEMELQGSIFHTGNDAEIISAVIIRERIQSSSIEEAICKAVAKLKGAYSLIVMSPQKLIAVRDRNGFHPLSIGQRNDGEYVIASETCALNSVGANFIREVEAGEIVVFSKEGVRSIKEHCGTAKESLWHGIIPGKMVNTTGCGDAFMGALVWAYLEGMNLEDTAAAGLAAGSITMESDETINPLMSAELLKKRMKRK